MTVPFLLYGSNGFVGDAIARLAVQQGLQPILAGRNAERVAAQAAELNLPYRVFSLDDPAAIDNALNDVPVVLHCAGPYRHTSRPMADACIRTGVHYLDLTGEIPVLSALAARDTEARIRSVMLLPAVGFDVVPTDCLAAHLKQRLPSATHLAIAFHTHGPAGLPPGTANTMLETIPLGFKLRRAGKLVNAPREGKTRLADFGSGPVTVTRLPWGDAFTAFHSTGIPDIVDYST
ncbi:MAG: NAD(P)H-binding protein, partial [Anaerolineaceae bacterium]|nr:NAD(P)H-binding protein [Anaerolineaceae bacterium]